VATRTKNPPAEEQPGADPDPDAGANGAGGDRDEGGALFDQTDYDDPRLMLDTVDGRDIDKIRLAFSGNVMLDRKDPNDVDLIRKLKLGQDLELRVSAQCAGKAQGFTTGKEGDLDAVVYTGGLKVTTVYVLAPEEL